MFVCLQKDTIFNDLYEQTLANLSATITSIHFSNSLVSKHIRTLFNLSNPRTCADMIITIRKLVILHETLTWLPNNKKVANKTMNSIHELYILSCNSKIVIRRQLTTLNLPKFTMRRVIKDTVHAAFWFHKCFFFSKTLKNLYSKVLSCNNALECFLLQSL